MTAFGEGNDSGKQEISFDEDSMDSAGEDNLHPGVDVIRTGDGADADPRNRQVQRGGKLHEDVDVVSQESSTEEGNELLVDDYHPRTDVSGENGESDSLRGLKNFGYWVTLSSGVGGARHVGKDRAVEAGLAENLHAKEYVRQNGGTVKDVTSSPFQPDNGIDKIIEQDGVEKAMQVKHWGDPVGESTLRQYESKVGAFGASNGLRDGVDPSEYEMEIITSQDWSWRRLLELEVNRVKRGTGIAISWVRNQVVHMGSRSVSLAKFVGRKAVNGTASTASLVWRGLLKPVTRGTRKLASRAVTKFLQQSLKRQALGVGGVLLILVILWYWHSRRED